MANSTGSAPLDQVQSVSFGRLRVDLVGFSVTVDGQDMPLTFSEFLLFKTLLMRPTQAVDRGTLMRALDTRQFSYKHGWSMASYRTVDLHMSRIRRKLAAAGYDCIKTMRFVGYRFVPITTERSAG